MQARTRFLVRAAVAAGSAYWLATCVGAAFLVNLALHPPHRPLDAGSASALGVPVENVDLSAADGVTLRAWFAAPAQPNGAAVILLHGVADNREGVAGYARMFLARGYDVLLPDARAHGESGGAFATYGVLERDDVRRWAAWLHPHAPGCEYLFGESMGAAIAIQASAVTPGICAIAVESSFATFREIASDRIAQISRLGLWFPHTLGAPARELALAWVDIFDRVNLAEASPLAAIRRSRVPTLLIAGTADDNIPMRHSQELERAGASHSQLWIVDGAEHTGAMTADPRDFERRVTSWFATHDTPPGPVE
ncbi:MAG TPA: alpha/beta fold hydrolase [Acidobacteriaceae bacterium]|nr:alpha/beta fold hydrolase [Acidobacteriaceae bacterium]